MTDYKPRKYQDEAVASTLRHWHSKSPYTWRAIVIAPTGSGKTVIGSRVLQGWDKHLEGQGKFLVIVQSKNLLYQQAKDFKSTGWRISLVGDGLHNIKGKLVVGITSSLARPKMLTRLMQETWDGIILDEGHHGVSDQHVRILDVLTHFNPQLRVLGLTAWPKRFDERGLREVFKVVSYICQYKPLIKAGYLAKPIQVTVRDVSVEAMYREWYKRAKDRRTIAFVRTVDDAWEYAAYFKSQGIKCGVVSADTGYSLRLALEGGKQVLFNVGVYIEGKDAPGISCILLFKGYSKGGYLQRVGRGMRPDSKDCIVIAPHHHDMLKKLQVADVLGIARPIEPMVKSRKPSMLSRLFKRLFGNKENLMASNFFIGMSAFVEEKTDPDKVIDQLEEYFEKIEDKHGQPPRRLGCLYEGLWTELETWCEERGITRLPQSDMPLNPANPLWLGFLKPKAETKPLNGRPTVAAPVQKTVTKVEPVEPSDDEEFDETIEPDGTYESDTFIAWTAEEREDVMCLELVFRKEPNKTHIYWDVHTDDVEGFSKATSKGAYYNQYIKGQYELTIEDTEAELLAA